MKKTITFLALLLLSTTLFSQDKLDFTTYEYDDGVGGWEFYSKSEFLYDIDNNLIEKIYLTMSDGVWENDNKTLYTYDANNNMIEELTYRWILDTGQWDVSFKMSLVYNTNNDFTSILWEYWQDGQWKNEEKVEFTYYSAGKINQYYYYEWDATAGVWDLDGRATASYNANIQLTSMLEESWTDTDWENDDQSFYTYNTAGKITEVLSQYWNDTAWSTYSQEIYELDTNSNRLTLTDYYGWETALEANYKTEYNYDMTKLQSNTVHPFNVEFYFLQDFPYFNKILDGVEYSYNEGAWDSETRVTHHYTNSAEISNESIIKASVYPNPTKSNIFIQLENTTVDTVSLFDTTGKLIIKETTLSLNKSIGLSNLKTGVYILEITDNKGNIVRKRVVKD